MKKEGDRCLTSPVSRQFLKKKIVMSKKIFIEVVAYDSRACSPCQYMVEMVKKVLPLFPDQIEWKESLITTREGMQRMKELGVSKLPTILINNVPEFISIIPSEHQLKAAIEKYLYPSSRDKPEPKRP